MIGALNHLAVLLIICGLTGSIPIREVRQADNCDHPFHSFLCNKAVKPRAEIQPDASASIPAKLAPQNANPSPPLYGENSFLDPTFIALTKKSVPPSTIKPTIAPTTPAAPKLQPVPDNSVLVPAFANPVPKKAKEEDLCSHPFHSFLCHPGKKSRKTVNNKVLVPENSFQSPVAIRPPSTTTTTTTTTTPRPRPTTRRATTTTTLPPQPEIPEASFDSPSFALPNNVQPKTVPPPAAKVEDLCGHSFHSWLCQPGKRKSANRKPAVVPESSILLPVALPPSTTKRPTTTTTTRPTTTTRRPTTTTRRPTTTRRVTTTTTTTPPPPVPEVPDASFDSPSFALPNKIQPVVAAPPKEDLCTHAFHSFLCNTGSRRKSQAKKTPPPPSEVPEQSVLLPVALPPSTTTRRPTTTTRRPTTTTTRRPTTTTRRPTTQRTTTTTESPIEPAPSIDFSERIPAPRKQEPIPAATSLQSLPEGYDKCKHAFHAFLCTTNTKRRRINEQPASSNIDNSLLLPVSRTTTTTTTTTPKPRPPPPPPPTTRRPPPPPTTRKATTTTTTRRPPPPPPPPTTKKPVEEDPNQIPDASFDDPQRINLPVVRSTTLSPHEDLCSHPFHSFLCAQNRNAPRTRRPIRIK